MSSTLFWEPIRPADKTLGTGLKFVLREAYGFPVDETFTPLRLSELSLLGAGRSDDVRKDVDTLIDAVKRFDVVRVFEGNW